MTTDDRISAIRRAAQNLRHVEWLGPDLEFLIAEVVRARQVFRDLLTANSSHDEDWVKGRARYGLGDEG